jgi:hypothetical protein
MGNVNPMNERFFVKISPTACFSDLRMTLLTISELETAIE